MKSESINKNTVKTVLIVTILVVAIVSIVLKTWIPLLALICTPLFLLIVGGVFATLLNNKKHMNIYLVSNQPEENKIISDRRFRKEKDKDILH